MYRKQAFGTSVCPDCGLRVPLPHLLTGRHSCGADDVTRAARMLQLEIAQFLASDEGQNLVAFAGWCREHGRD
jgi:hypothetical protein